MGRVWFAPKAGTIQISGWILKNTTGGNGVHAHIYSTHCSCDLWSSNVGANDQTGMATNASNVTVSQGDQIAFEVSNGGSGNNTSDATSWAPNIIYTSGGPSIVNAGFEAPSLGTGNGAYRYNPSNATWAFVAAGGNGGIGHRGERQRLHEQQPQRPGRHAGSVPAGIRRRRVAGDRRVPANTAYTFTFSAAQRANYPSQSVQVYLDSTLLGTYTPSGTSYADITTGQGAPSAGTHTLKFQGTGNNNQDVTAFIDNVRVGPSIGNPGFEAPSLGTGNSAYQYNPSNATWAFVAAAAVAARHRRQRQRLHLQQSQRSGRQQVAFLQGSARRRLAGDHWLPGRHRLHLHLLGGAAGPLSIPVGSGLPGQHSVGHLHAGRHQLCRHHHQPGHARRGHAHAHVPGYGEQQPGRDCLHRQRAGGSALSLKQREPVRTGSRCLFLLRL